MERLLRIQLRHWVRASLLGIAFSTSCGEESQDPKNYPEEPTYLEMCTDYSQFCAQRKECGYEGDLCLKKLQVCQSYCLPHISPGVSSDRSVGLCSYQDLCTSMYCRATAGSFTCADDDPYFKNDIDFNNQELADCVRHYNLSCGDVVL